MNFEKYHGTGNDFIVADNRDGSWNLSVDQVKHLCDRHLGIGSDGVILIEEDDQSDFYVNFFNPDGSQSFCGNGSRCAVHFAQSLGILVQSCKFRAVDGAHEGHIEAGEIKINLTRISSIEIVDGNHVIHTGSPHFIQYVPDIEKIDVVAEGSAIRYNDRYKAEGINVNFVSQNDSGIAMRTYERGVEDETLSCGTGVTAAALVHASLTGNASPIHVSTRGGNLRVFFEKSENGFSNVWLQGPVTRVFSGEVKRL